MICPFMSRPVLITEQHHGQDNWRTYTETNHKTKLIVINCFEGKCRAWEPATYYCKMSPICPRVDMSGCDVDTCPDAKKAEYTKGYCGLIPGV